MEEHIGGGGAAMALILSPIVLIAIFMFPLTTEIPSQYGIRIGDLIFYMLFGILMAPFQVMMDIILNNAVEISQGVKIFDYMMYAKYRWRNRLVRWMFDDPRFDRTVNETVQSVNHLCFSPQYYFIQCYFTWGIVLKILAVTIMCRAQFNPLEDPAFGYFVAQQFFANRMLDKLVRFISFLIWQPPKASVAAKKFYREVTRNLKVKQQEYHSHKWRSHFYKQHKHWILQHMDLVLRAMLATLGIFSCDLAIDVCRLMILA